MLTNRTKTPGMGSGAMLRTLRREARNNGQLYLILLPALTYYLIFHYWPMYGVQIAFRDFMAARGIWGSRWVGLANITRFLRSYSAPMVIANTLRVSLLSLVLGFPGPVLLALMIHELRNPRYKKALQILSYAPHFISTVAIVGMLTIMLSTRGLFNAVLARFGAGPVPFLTDPVKFVYVYVLSGIWQNMGWGSVIYFSVLSGIDPQMHEAALIDGANKMQRIRYIDLPTIAPTMIILLIMNCGSILSVGWEKIYLMQNSLNLSASEVISTYVYKIGLINADYSYSAAIGLFNSVVNLAMLLIVNGIARRVSETSLW